jgi:hypothetical protein
MTPSNYGRTAPTVKRKRSRQDLLARIPAFPIDLGHGATLYQTAAFARVGSFETPATLMAEMVANGAITNPRRKSLTDRFSTPRLRESLSQTVIEALTDPDLYVCIGPEGLHSVIEIEGRA